MSVTYDYSGKCVLITGAASGMGLATAQGFAAAGASVMLSDINAAALDKIVSSLQSSKGTICGFVCDVADESQVEALVNETVSKLGGLDIAFNNAGIQVPACDAAEETAENFDRVNGINLRGVWACQKHELAYMGPKGAGVIVNCSSTGGLVGLERLAAYHASKHGVLGLTKSAALEYAKRGVRINAVCPGAIDTPMVEDMLKKGALTEEMIAQAQLIGRLGKAEEVAKAVMWLASEDASFTVGHALTVDGGFTAH